jgi:5-methyltetrahydropteroyltriglutamate--homocysteine methyltransferase
MVQALHDHLERRLPEAGFHATADDAVRLAVAAQLRAAPAWSPTASSAGTTTRASWVAGWTTASSSRSRTSPLVDDPEKFRREMESLDVPTARLRLRDLADNPVAPAGVAEAKLHAIAAAAELARRG